MPILKYIRSIKIKIEKYLPNHSLGFTLLELMIAVSIMAIIASIGFVSFNQAQLLARDSKRKQDLRNIAVALEIYYQKNKKYPQAGPSCAYGSNCYVTSTSGAGWIPALDSSYISKLPLDPINTGQPFYTSSTAYGYSYGNVSSSGNYYDLITRLENTQDKETCGNNGNYQLWCGIGSCSPACPAKGGTSLHTNDMFILNP